MNENKIDCSKEKKNPLARFITRKLEKNRMDTISLIEQFTPRTELQQKSKALILAEIAQHGDRLYGRDSLHAHLSASAIILNPDLNKTLMVYHNIYNSYAWTGGHADGEQDLYAVAHREACEETGIEKLYPVSRSLLSVECLPVPEHMKNGKSVAFHQHYNLTFGFIAPDNQRLQIKPDENSSVAWLDIDQLAEVCSEREMLPIYEDNIRQIDVQMRQKQQCYQSLAGKLLPWYEKNARDLPWRKDQEPYHVWLSEIMLQQTRVDTVIDYYKRFLAEFPAIEALANADEERVLKLWEGLGYYSRARNLQRAAKVVVEEYGGQFPDTPERISKLPGIGAYTTGAIASICFDQPVPAVDGNVLRVVSRITEDYRCIDDDTTKKAIGAELAAVYPKGRCGDFTQSLMELGATICLPNGEPKCGDCPAADICMAKQSRNAALLPVRKAKKARKTQALTLLILTCGEKIAVQKRLEKGVLHDMWELPNMYGVLEAQGVRDWLDAQGGCGTVEGLTTGKHIFTHIEWQIRCFTIACEKPFGDYLWADKDMMATEISLPTAFRKFLTMQQLALE